MDEQRVAGAKFERELVEEVALRDAELAAGPLDCDLRLEVHAHVVMADGAVMVADHGVAPCATSSRTLSTTHSGSAP